MNKIKIIAIILAVTTVAGAVLFFVTRGNSPEVPDIPQDEVFSLETSPYTAEVSAAGNSKCQSTKIRSFKRNR